MNTYEMGTLVRVTCTFRDIDGEPANPTAVTADVLLPGATASTPASLSSGSTGVYHADIPTEEPGIYRVRFEGTGSVVVAAEHAFTVRRSAFD